MIRLTWADFKSKFPATMMTYLQDNSTNYEVWVPSSGVVISCYLAETVDKTDFETNFKNAAHDAATVIDMYLVSVDQIEYSSARDSVNTTNIYLRNDDGLPTNVAPFTIPYNATITTITASADGNYTWDAQVHINGVSVASLNIPNVPTMYNSGFNVNVNLGDRLSLYCQGEQIKKPRINTILKRR